MIGAVDFLKGGVAHRAEDRHFFDASRSTEWQRDISWRAEHQSSLSIAQTPPHSLDSGQRLSTGTRYPPDERGWVVVAPSASKAPFIVLFVPVIEHAKQKNRLHLDLNPIAVDHESEVPRLVELGATRASYAASEDPWTTMQDPEGNYFCVMHRTVT